MSRRANILLVLVLAIGITYGRFGVPFLLPVTDSTQAMFEEPESEWELKATILQRQEEVQQTEVELKRWRLELKRMERLHCLFDQTAKQELLVQVETCKRRLANAKAVLANARTRLAELSGNVVASVPAADTAAGK
jgi:hypothetical protein